MTKLHHTNPKTAEHNNRARQFFQNPTRYLEFEEVVMKPLHGETKEQWQARMEHVIKELELWNDIHTAHALNLRRRIGLVKLPKE